MALLSVQNGTAAGLIPTLVAATATTGDTFPNDGKTILIVKNGSGSSINVTIDATKLCSHGFEHDVTFAVAAGAQAQFGPFDPDRFNTSAGLVKATCSAVTTVTVGAVRLAK